MGALTEFSNHMDWQGMLMFLMSAVACLICLTIHELSHGLIARQLGDPTAKVNGRLTLNPLAHIDWVGLFLLLTVGVGWAKPVPVDPRYFRRPKQGMAITALAGPVSNFVLAYLSAIVYSALCAVAVVRGETTGLSLALEFFAVLVTLNIGLGIFNLIPFPPLDGSKVVAMFLPDRLYLLWMRLERYGMLVLMALLWFGVLDGFLGAARSWMLDGMLRGAEFAYTGMLSALL